jgi:hypothetical protein
MFGLSDFVSDVLLEKNVGIFWCLSYSKDAVVVSKNTNIVFLAYSSPRKSVLVRYSFWPILGRQSVQMSARMLPRQTLLMILRITALIGFVHLPEI